MRRFDQSATPGDNGGVIANQRPQIVRRNNCGSAREIGPAGEREQRPDQEGTKFFGDEDENENDERNGKQSNERRLASRAQQQPDGVTGNDSDKRTFHWFDFTGVFAGGQESTTRANPPRRQWCQSTHPILMKFGWEQNFGGIR